MADFGDSFDRLADTETWEDTVLLFAGFIAGTTTSGWSETFEDPPSGLTGDDFVMESGYVTAFGNTSGELVNATYDFDVPLQGASVVIEPSASSRYMYEGQFEGWVRDGDGNIVNLEIRVWNDADVQNQIDWWVFGIRA